MLKLSSVDQQHENESYSRRELRKRIAPTPTPPPMPKRSDCLAHGIEGRLARSLAGSICCERRKG
jgi:hypothetical protein